MKGADNWNGVFVGEGPEDVVHHVAQLAGVDEEHFALGVLRLHEALAKTACCRRQSSTTQPTVRSTLPNATTSKAISGKRVT